MTLKLDVTIQIWKKKNGECQKTKLSKLQIVRVSCIFCSLFHFLFWWRLDQNRHKQFAGMHNTTLSSAHAHTHIHTRTHTHAHTHSVTHGLTRMLSHTHTVTHILSISHKHTHTHTHTHTHKHTRTHTHFKMRQISFVMDVTLIR